VGFVLRFLRVGWLVNVVKVIRLLFVYEQMSFFHRAEEVERFQKVTMM